MLYKSWNVYPVLIIRHQCQWNERVVGLDREVHAYRIKYKHTLEVSVLCNSTPFQLYA